MKLDENQVIQKSEEAQDRKTGDARNRSESR